MAREKAENTVKRTLFVRLDDKAVEKREKDLVSAFKTQQEAEAEKSKELGKASKALRDMEKEAQVLTKRRAGKALSAKLLEIHNARVQYDAMRAQHAATVAAAKAKVDLLQNIVASGCELDEVDCEVEYDYDEKKVIITRKDTKVVVETREMQPEEFQAPLKAVK